MRHLNLIPVVFGLSMSTFACGGVQHDSPDSVQYGAPTLLTCSDGSTSSVIAVADFNGDHVPDLLGCQGYDTASVFMGSGGGVFADGIVVYLQEGIESILPHDVDGDGKADLVIYSRDSDYADHMNIEYSNGDGTFGRTIEQPNYPASCDPYHYSLDGHANAICYSSGKVVVYDMVSDGSGSQAFTVAAPTWPTLLDVDHDGKLDFVYAVGASVAVSLNLGGNVFAPTQVVIVADTQVKELVPVDIDGDGFTDLVVVLSGVSADTFAFMHNEAGTGFKELTSMLRPPGVGLAFQDVTGDDVMDIVATQDDAIIVMVGKGDGKFEDNALALTGPWTNSAGFQFGDLNGDGKPDLVVGGSNISVLLRQ